MYITGVTTTSSLNLSTPSTLANFGWKKGSNNEFIVEFLATWIAMAFFVFATFISLIVLFIKVRNMKSPVSPLKASSSREIQHLTRNVRERFIFNLLFNNIYSGFHWGECCEYASGSFTSSS